MNRLEPADFLASILTEELLRTGSFSYTEGLGLEDDDVGARVITTSLYDLVSRPDTAFAKCVEDTFLAALKASNYNQPIPRPKILKEMLVDEVKYHVEDLTIAEISANIRVKEASAA